MENNKKLETMIAAFVRAPQKDAFVDILKELETYKLYAPAHADEEGKPTPLLLKKSDGIPILPVFTSTEQIPEERKTQMLLELPYEVCISLAVQNPEKIKEIVVNPFTEPFVVNKEAIEVAKRRLLDSKESKTVVQMTELEFHQYALKKMAYDLIPARFTKEGAAAMTLLAAEHEAMILEFAKMVYPDNLKCPYAEDDFSVMVLQVSDDMKIGRIDLPETYVKEQVPLRSYIVENASGEIQCFAIEKGKESNRVLRITGDGECAPAGEVQDSGVEIEKIMEIAGA